LSVPLRRRGSISFSHAPSSGHLRASFAHLQLVRTPIRRGCTGPHDRLLYHDLRKSSIPWPELRTLVIQWGNCDSVGPSQRPGTTEYQTVLELTKGLKIRLLDSKSDESYILRAPHAHLTTIRQPNDGLPLMSANCCFRHRGIHGRSRD